MTPPSSPAATAAAAMGAAEIGDENSQLSFSNRKRELRKVRRKPQLPPAAMTKSLEL